MFPNSNFDDWKWATEQICIHNEITLEMTIFGLKQMMKGGVEFFYFEIE